MSENKRTVEKYMEAYNRLDHEEILGCLTDDVQWLMPGAFDVHGKKDFDGQIESDCFVGAPVINVLRLTEENDIVIAEGSVKSAMTDGGVLDAMFCDVFEMQNAKIRKLTSYVAALSTGDESNT
jgi:ketosteroid isomerase-like protein